MFYFKNDKEDILSRFLVESRKDPEKMTDQYLRDIILNFMIAGKDATANTLSWFFYMLCENPLIQERVAEQVKDVTGNQCSENSIDDFMASITDERLEKLHYLHATLTGTLRLYPAVPLVIALEFHETSWGIVSFHLYFVSTGCFLNLLLKYGG